MVKKIEWYDERMEELAHKNGWFWENVADELDEIAEEGARQAKEAFGKEINNLIIPELPRQLRDDEKQVINLAYHAGIKRLEVEDSPIKKPRIWVLTNDWRAKITAAQRTEKKYFGDLAACFGFQDLRHVACVQLCLNKHIWVLRDAYGQTGFHVLFIDKNGLHGWGSPLVRDRWMDSLPLLEATATAIYDAPVSIEDEDVIEKLLAMSPVEHYDPRKGGRGTIPYEGDGKCTWKIQQTKRMITYERITTLNINTGYPDIEQPSMQEIDEVVERITNG